MDYVPQYLKATVTITLPAIEADAAEFETYDVSEMIKKYKHDLENDFLGSVDDILASDMAEISAKVELRSTPED